MKIKFDDRQNILSAFVPLVIGNIGADAAAGADNARLVTIPAGTLVLRANGFTAQAWDGTAAVNVKGLSDNTVYSNAVDYKAAGNKTLTGFPKYFPNGETFEVSLVGDSDATGLSFVNLEFVVKDRGNEVYE